MSVRLALMVLVVVAFTGGSCNSGDPPNMTNVLLEINRQAVRPAFTRIDFTVKHIELFYDQPPAPLPINEGVDHDCNFPGAVDATGSLGPVGFDISATGLVPIGGFQAHSGNVTEIRIVIDALIVTHDGVQESLKGQLRCSENTNDHYEVLRLIPGSPITLSANDTAALQVDFDPNRDIFTGEVGAQNGNQGNGHGQGNGNGKGPAAPGLRLSGSFVLELVPLDRNLIIPGLIFVTFKDGVTDQQVDLVNAFIGGKVIWRPYPFAEWLHVDGDELAAIETLQSSLITLPYVNAAAPELLVHPTALPNDFNPAEWYMMADKTNVVGAWNVPQVGSRNVILAVIDTGVDLVNRDMLQNLFINKGELPAAWVKDFDGDGVISFHDFNPDDAAQKAQVQAFLTSQNFVDTSSNGTPNGVVDPYDFRDTRNHIVDNVDNDNNGFVDDLVGWDFSPITDDHGNPTGLPGNNNPDDPPPPAGGHGTVVASIAAAVGNNADKLLPGASSGGIAGVTWFARILPLKVINEKGEGQGLMPILTALKYAQSLGAAVAVSSLAATVVRKNVDIGGCTAAIQPSSSNGAFDNFKGQSQANWDKFGITIPVVASLTNCKLDYDSGNFFSYPGGIGRPNIISVTATDQSDAIPNFAPTGSNSIDIGAPGVKILALPVHGTNVDPNGVTGTSSAAPLVAGTVALMVAQKPSLLGNGVDIRNRIIATGDRTGIATAGGRLNAFKAVTAP